MTIDKFMPLMSLMYNQCQKLVRVRSVYYFTYRSVMKPRSLTNYLSIS